MDNQCIVQVKLELGHRAQLRKKPTTEGFTHDWMVFVRGPEQFEIQHFVERVVFRLHQSFPKPKRVCKEPPYKVEESGYAGFIMPIEVHFKNKEEPKRVCFTYDLFLNLEGNPPVNHLRCEKLTFNNPTKDFRRKLIKAGGVMVMPEGAEAVSRPSPDYPMLPTIPLSAFSDPKRTKPSHGSKEASKDGNKVSKPHKVTREHRERSRKDSESKGSSREPEREPGKPPKDASRKPADNKPPKDEKPPPKAAFKEPKLSLKEPKLENASPKGGGGGGGVPPAPEGKLPSKRPPAVESPKLAAKKAKKSSSKPAKGGGGLPATSPRAPSAVAAAYTEKKPPKEKPGGKSEKAKPEPEAKALKKPLEVSVVEESNSEEEVSLKSESAPSSPSNSSSSSDSSSDSDFEPSQNHSQGALRCGGPHGLCVRWWRTCSPKSRTMTTAPPGRTRPSRPPPSAETPGSATATATTAPAPASRAERPLPARSCPLLITRSPGGKAPSRAPSRKRSLRKECTIRPTPTSWWSCTGG